ncbi:class I SAM-dependent methyltransferase [Streptomyces sp. NPDC087263]|uniref:class I SAM-dependent methyltransferase n=1 Tax=Streptomyces sp. NPDC087263 TaxID=3365773 RepID=UPI0037FE4433
MSDVVHDSVKSSLAQLFDRSAPTYEKVGVDHFADLGRRLVDHAGIAAGERVLDVGCGTGAVLVPAARATGPRGEVIGVDLSAGMAARAEEEIVRHGLPQARVVVGDAETLAADGIPADPGSYDAVLAGICLFFYPRPEEAMARYRRLLKPDGRFALSWWGRPDPRWDAVFTASAPFGRGPSSHALPGDSPFRSVEALHAALLTAGFDDVDTVEEDCVTRFDSDEQWWQWVWSTAGRQFWESVPEELRPDAVAAVNAELARLKAADGSLSSTSKVRFTLARRVS